MTAAISAGSRCFWAAWVRITEVSLRGRVSWRRVPPIRGASSSMPTTRSAIAASVAASRLTPEPCRNPGAPTGEPTRRASGCSSSQELVKNARQLVPQLVDAAVVTHREHGAFGLLLLGELSRHALRGACVIA